jgi:hypothetical protein
MSNAELQSTVLMLAREVGRLTEMLNPFVGTEEMCRRYNCTGQTLTAMERRGEIPMRTRGKWSRSELQQWEQRRST